MQLEEAGACAILREDFSLQRPEPARQSLDLAVAVTVQLCSAVLGSGWTPLQVGFSHQAPPPEELGIFARMFRCRIEFDSEFSGIVISAADLDRRNPRADAQLARQARQLIEAVMSPAEHSTADEVEQLIGLLLSSGQASVQTCAAALGLTVRSLQRMLDSEGTSFSTLLQRARMQLATQYLANPRLRITDVAQMLGYSSIGAFTRWHTKTFSSSPLRWRKSSRISAR